MISDEKAKGMRCIDLRVGASASAVVPETEVHDAQMRLRSWKAIESPIIGERPIFRMLDVGARYGLFATFAAIRWPYAYLDCFEADRSNRQLLRLNAQAGTKIAFEMPRPLPKCDALHVHESVRNVQLDGEALADLRLAFWEFESSETFEGVATLLRACGLELAHVGMYYAQPAKGWQLWLRR